MARSLDSYRRYYEEWAAPWEMLALVKARPVAGDAGLCSSFTEAMAPFLWQPVVPAATLRAIREIKARVESERIPADEDPDYHLKLGPGGLSDVEFLTQLLQLTHGHRDHSLRTTSTLAALQAIREASILPSQEVGILEEAYVFCTRVRMRLHLRAGRALDSLPTDPADLVRLASSLGFDRASELREQYRRLTRRARQVFKSRFYE